jgi:hypothetical protein
MRLLKITGTAIDLAAQKAPFLPNYTVVLVNNTAGELTVQDSDDDSTYGTLKVIAAGAFEEVTLRKQYIKVSTSATVNALGN